MRRAIVLAAHGPVVGGVEAALFHRSVPAGALIGALVGVVLALGVRLAGSVR